eukprot:COSAG01_NODE_1633_length_9666_cov_569.421135_6_plen_46_part_00
MRRVALKDVCGCPFFGMSVRETGLSVGGRREISGLLTGFIVHFSA